VSNFVSICICVFFSPYAFNAQFIGCVCQAKIPNIEKCLHVVATLEAKRGTGEVYLDPVFP